MKTKHEFRQYFAGLIVIIMLIIISQLNILLFHTMAELFSIVVIFAVFMFTWNTRRYINNQYLLYIGIVLVFTGFIDLLHTVTYKGIQIIPLDGLSTGNISSQLWIASRYLQSISFLIAPFLFFRKIRLPLVIAIYHLAVFLIVLSVFFWKIFPVCLLEGRFTGFKIFSEFFISLIYLISLFLLWKRKNEFDRQLYHLLGYALGSMMISELMLAVHTPGDHFAMLGLILKVTGFFFIYKAIIVAGLQQPVEVLFNDLNQSRQRLLQNKKMLEEKVRLAVEEVQEKNKMLILQSRHAQLGEMIAAITHQWKQPLNQIAVLSAALLDAWNYNELDKSYLERTIDNISKVVLEMNTILNDFRSFYAPQDHDVEFDLAEIKQPLEALAGRRLKKYNIDLILEIEPGLKLKGKINEILQVLLVLINNAVDAVSDNLLANAEIKITAERIEDNISLTVRDNAGGIASENLDNLFVPYFTTKGDKGTGMGLFLAKTIIEKHFDGNIKARNYQHGAEFNCLIPAV